MPKKIDPLNKKQVRALTALLVVTDVKVAAAFYQKAFGFAKRAVMNGPDGKPMHAELTFRDSTVMLGPENLERGFKSAKTLGTSPVGLYLMVENVDKVVAKAIKAGGKAQGPVMDMFWGDRCGTVTDPEGYGWTIATHVSEPTPAEMKKAMQEMAKQQTSAASTAS